ncbi:response regulator, partial [Nostoc sp. 'Peltigera malacea cyanobiont' DB3992]|uniref:response regulator n=1 Tax=Nostoc sp. 'Peltigera malacea cyanobiont' DB3992 TaxID=1206980 RepID=UPI00117E3A76
MLDYRLPDLDGLEFLTKLQRQTSNSRISVIMLTGQGDETIAVQAIKSGAQDYLVKGKLTSDNLRRAVHGAIEQMQLMRQLKQQQEQQKLVGAIALNIRQSLKLQDILATSVQEVRQLLDAFQFIGLLTPAGILLEAQQSILARQRGMIVPDIARKQDQVFRQVLTTGEPILDLEISGETPKFPGVIRTWLASYFPIQSEADEPISMGIVVVEISDRKRAE